MQIITTRFQKLFWGFGKSELNFFSPDISTQDSSGHIGFQFKDGRISSIAVDSSAARNGLLVEHNLLEVNGQNVVGVKDKEIGNIIEEGGNVITVTIIPSYIYNHIMKR